MEKQFEERDLHPPLMLLIALLQGLLLLLLHQAIEREFWPHQSPQWLFSFYAMSFAGPLLLLLSVVRTNLIRLLTWLLPFVGLLGLLGYYVGSQATPLPHVNFESMLFAFVLTLALACFKAIMYVQSQDSFGSWDYRNLFLFSWRNFLTLALGALFAGCFWGVMMLWAFLFRAIDLDFFYDLFTESWFYYPAVSLANGVGILLFRHLSSVVDTITRLLQALMKFLLVLLSLVSLLFMSALPFTGLEPLWESGGSALILWLQALLLFAVNSVYQADPGSRPYGVWLHRLIALAVVTLPIYSAVSLYGLWLRIDQYGLSLSRLWALLIWFLLMLCALGYALGIARRRDDWLNFVAWVNQRLGLVLLAAMLLVNSPLLDFRKLTVQSQLARLEAGKTLSEKFDIGYFRHHLAGPGYRALQDLRQSRVNSDPALVLRIDNLYRNTKTEPVLDRALLAAALESTDPLPPDLVDQIYKDLRENAWQMAENRAYVVVPVQLDGQGETEYLLAAQREHYTRLSVYALGSDGWREFNVNRRDLRRRTGQRQTEDSRESVIEQLRRGELQLKAPRFQQLQLGETLIQVEEQPQ